MFGGSPKWERGKSDAAQQKLAKTTVLEFGELSIFALICNFSSAIILAASQ